MRLVNEEYAVGETTGIGNSTNAMGSSGIEPGQPPVSIEICPSPIGDSLDMLANSWDCLERSSSSSLDMHRDTDAAV